MTDQTKSMGQRRARLVLRKDVLAGLMFMALALLGLWLSRGYPMGTTLRMGTGYVPRLLCGLLLALGGLVALQGSLGRGAAVAEERGAWRALLFIPAAFVVFALTIERFGLVVSSTSLIVIGALAGRQLRLTDVAITALALVALCVALFVWGLALPIKVWPEW